MNNSHIKEKNFLSALRGHPKLGMFSVDTDMVCLEWNNGMHNFTGISQEEVVLQNTLSKFPDLSASSHFAHINAAFNKEKIYIESASLFPFSSSAEENYSISYLPILNDENNVEGCLLLIQEKEATDHKREKINERNGTLLKCTGAGIWQINPLGYTQYLNPAMCSILGIESMDDLNGKTFHSFFSEATLQKMKEEHHKRSQNISSNYEAELIRSDGSVRNIMIYGVPQHFENGEVETFIGTFIDITDKKLAETELKKSEERFRLFFEKTLTPTALTRNGVLLFVNEAYLKLFKYDSAEELIGKTFFHLIDEQHHEEVTRDIKLRKEGKNPPTFYELIGIKKDGTRFLFELELSVIELPDGEATIVAIRDISKQKEAELALKASEVKFKGLFSSSMIGIAFSSLKDWKIVEANNKFLEIIQYTQEDVSSNLVDWNCITPPEYAEKDQKAFLDYMEKGHINPYEKEFIRKDGSRVPVLIAAASTDNPYSGVTFIVDITDLKASQEETNKIANELSTFLYMASHDLKGPLASVIGLTNIARTDVEDMKALDYINLIQECTLKLDRSLMNFLKIIRIKNNVLNRDPIDFNVLIEEIISSLKHQVSFAKVEFAITDNTVSTYYSDADILKSIIQNLVENSVKYQTRLREPLIKIKIDEDDENIYLTVDDNGRGIDEKIKDKIFDMFYRGDISSKGSGLGLYIVKNAAEKLGGIVEARNKIEGGCAFTVTIPKTLP